MLFVAGALAIFVVGGLTGVMVALAPFDWQAHDTYFIVAHLHYTLIGGMLFPVVAGIYYFYPAITGRRLSDRLGRTAFWLMLRRLQRHLRADAPDRPARHAAARLHLSRAGSGWDWLNLISTVGAFVFAAGFLVVVWDVLRPKGREPYAPRNPWNAGTLEWLAEIPGKPWGVRSVPVIESRYPLWEQQGFVAQGRPGPLLPARRRGGQARDAGHQRASTPSPMQCLRVPGPSFLPMIAAVFTGGAFIFPTFHMYAGGLVSGALAICRDPGLAVDRHRDDPREAGEGRRPRPAPAALRLRARARSAGGRCSSPCSATRPRS